MKEFWHKITEMMPPARTIELRGTETV